MDTELTCRRLPPKAASSDSKDDASLDERAGGVSAGGNLAVPDVKINRIHPRPGHAADWYTHHRPFEPPRGVDSSLRRDEGVTNVSHPRSGNTETPNEFAPSSSTPVLPSTPRGGSLRTDDFPGSLGVRRQADDIILEPQMFTPDDTPQSVIHDRSALRRSFDFLNTLTSRMNLELLRHPTAGFRSAQSGPKKTDYLAQILVSLGLLFTFEFFPVFVGIGVVGLMLLLLEKLLRWALGSMCSPRGGSYHLFDLLETIRVVRWYHANVCLMSVCLMSGCLLGWVGALWRRGNVEQISLL